PGAPGRSCRTRAGRARRPPGPRPRPAPGSTRTRSAGPRGRARRAPRAAARAGPGGTSAACRGDGAGWDGRSRRVLLEVVPPGRTPRTAPTFPGPPAAQERADLTPAATGTPYPHAQGGLAHDGVVHLGGPHLALDEGHRHLHHAQSLVQGTEGEVDLEAVALGGDRGGVHRSQRVGPVDT